MFQYGDSGSEVWCCKKWFCMVKYQKRIASLSHYYQNWIKISEFKIQPLITVSDELGVLGKTWHNYWLKMRGGFFWELIWTASWCHICLDAGSTQSALGLPCLRKPEKIKMLVSEKHPNEINLKDQIKHKSEDSTSCSQLVLMVTAKSKNVCRVLPQRIPIQSPCRRRLGWLTRLGWQYMPFRKGEFLPFLQTARQKWGWLQQEGPQGSKLLDSHKHKSSANHIL